MRAVIQNVGSAFARPLGTLTEFGHFFLCCIGELTSFRWTRGVVLKVLIRQIYFTALQSLGMFTVLSAIYGIISGLAFHALQTLDLVAVLGGFVVDALVFEAAPLVSALFVALRSSSAVNAEVALMKVNGELDALASFRVDVVEYLFAPRLLGFTFAVPALSVVFSTTVLLVSFAFSSLIFQTETQAFSKFIASAVDLGDIALVVFRGAALGFAIAILPLFFGFKTPREMRAIPISVLNGMTGVFYAIFVVEVASLAIRLLLSSS